MESSASINVDISKFLELGASQETPTTPKWKCSDYALKMLEEGIHADVTLRVKAGSVKAHKSVLACVSPVFKAMFQHDMKEQLTSVVDIPNMSVDTLQLFLLLLYGTNDACNEDVFASPPQMPDSKTVTEKEFRDIEETAVIRRQMPQFRAAIDKHFWEFYDAVLKYQVESRLGPVLVYGLARNLTPENCWYYFGRLETAAPRPFRSVARSMCVFYILGKYHDVIESQSFLAGMRCNPSRVQRIIARAESRDARRKSLELYLLMKSL